MNKRTWWCAVTTALLIGGVAMAQDTPYQRSHNVNSFQSQGGTRIITPAQLHPNVTVSRTLAAQPVHPHMVKVIIGGGSPGANTSAGAGQISTWIDPMRKLDGDGGLDENHSLVKAQRLYLSLTMTSTEELNAIRSHSHEVYANTYAQSNRVRIVVNPKARQDAAGMARAPKPMMVLTKPVDTKAKPQAQPAPEEKPVPMPVAPTRDEDREETDLVASAE